MSQVTVKEKFGYGLGDTASNIVFQVVINFMTFFYTDVFGITAAAAGTLMLAVRIFDGVTDPMMGAIADRTKTRFGRYRPWMLWMSVPYGVLAVLTFTTPDLSDTGKLIYAYVTYAVLMTVYTAVNIPYCALGGVIATDPQERASVQAWRFGLAMAGGAIVAATTLPLVDLLGGEDKAAGFSRAMMVLGALAVVCFVACFLLTRERAEAETDKPKQPTNARADLVAMAKNSQWQIIAWITFLSLVGVVMRGGMTPYYVQYYLGQEDMVTLFVTAGMLAGILGALVSGVAVKRFCKVSVMRAAVIGIIVFHVALFLVPRDQVYLALALTCLANGSHMVFTPLVFSAVPDTVDYGLARGTGGGMGMSVSGHLLALKLGVAVGGAMVGWFLGWHGYVAGQEQDATSLAGIVRAYAAASAVTGALIYVALRFYKLKQGWRQELAPALAS